MRCVVRSRTRPGLLQARECEVEEAVGTAVLGEAVSEVGQHTVVEAGVVQLHGHRIFVEVDAAADRLGGLPVGQAEQELQQTDGGQLSGRETRTPVPRVPVGEVLVAPQPIEAVTHPYRRRAARVARPRNLRSQRRDLLTGTGTKGQRTPRQLYRSAELHEHARRSCCRTGKLQDPRQSQARRVDEPRFRHALNFLLEVLIHFSARERVEAPSRRASSTRRAASWLAMSSHTMFSFSMTEKITFPSLYASQPMTRGARSEKISIPSSVERSRGTPMNGSFVPVRRPQKPGRGGSVVAFTRALYSSNFFLAAGSSTSESA
ncbi:hypothetical protein SHJG_p1128 (plasmid) [Streptomyces hygroscopicus subsp. jinggangensis 5008]|nr:hypothetical protein SHJG_p1128 [Streptomyces hygroscopicus subsp. jinggangensis 5008]AGF68413.1 hypothetical protein SHJGH_p1128 [Streptomyces hygroscopicus subsp. jinggangensis TL01]